MNKFIKQFDGIVDEICGKKEPVMPTKVKVSSRLSSDEFYLYHLKDENKRLKEDLERCYLELHRNVKDYYNVRTGHLSRSGHGLITDRNQCQCGAVFTAVLEDRRRPIPVWDENQHTQVRDIEQFYLACPACGEQWRFIGKVIEINWNFDQVRNIRNVRRPPNMDQMIPPEERRENIHVNEIPQHILELMRQENILNGELDS